MALFRKESLEHVSAPEQLTDYIKTGGSGIWLALAAILVLLGGAIFWGLTAAIPSSVSFRVIAVAGSNGERYTAFLPPETAGKLRPGMEARLENVPARITAMTETPLSAREAAGVLSASHASDYTAYALGITEWNIVVSLETEEPPGGGELKNARVTTGVDRPLDFLINAAAKKK